mmetsp:Transcript_26996/g.56175  ORF Transcript_26996/g.56175 Transcript_26996/m.56175 type:complete len:286 (-) Transcript_26996:463-1320(-)
MQPRRQPFCSFVILCQPLYVIFQRIHPHCRHDTGLSHPPSQLLPRPSRQTNKLLIPHQNRTHRSAQPLRQTKGDRIGPFTQFSNTHSQRNRRIEYPRPINMDLNLPSPLVFRQPSDPIHITLLHRHTPEHIMRVLQSHQHRLGIMIVVIPPKRIPQILHIHFSILILLDQLSTHTGQIGISPSFVQIDMRMLPHDHLGRFIIVTMRQNGAQIAHGSRGDEESGGLIEEGSGVSFEGEDGGVFGEDVVSGGGAEGGLEHGGSGGGEGVGAEIGYIAVVVVLGGGGE